MNRTAQFLLAIVFCAAVTPSLQSSDAIKDDHTKSSHDLAFGNKHAAEAPEDKWEHDPIRFSASDRVSIRNDYRSNSRLIPKPAKSRGRLELGLQKQLLRNGKLPVGLQQRLEPLSDDLERRLHALESPYSRGMIGQDIVIVENRTQRVMDIFRYAAGR